MQMGRAWLVIGFAAVLVTAGCIGMPGGTDDDDLDAASADGTDGPGQAGSAAETVQMDEDGLVTTRAFVCGHTPVVVQCVGSQPEEGENVFEMPVQGAAEAATFEVSWEPSSPETETLRFGVSLRCDTEDCEEFEIAEGSSPLEVTLDEEDLGETSYVWVQPSSRTPYPVYTLVAYEQPFTLTGEIEAVR